jgi:hypothetical protein
VQVLLPHAILFTNCFVPVAPITAAETLLAATKDRSFALCTFLIYLIVLKVDEFKLVNKLLKVANKEKLGILYLINNNIIFEFKMTTFVTELILIQ